MANGSVRLGVVSRLVLAKRAAEEWLWKPLKELRNHAPIAAKPLEAMKVLRRLETEVFE